MRKLILLLLVSVIQPTYAGYKEKKLIKAAYENNYHKLKMWLNQRAKVNQLQRVRGKNYYIYSGMTALYWAVKNNNYKMTKLLLRRGAKTSYTYTEKAKIGVKNRYKLIKTQKYPLLNCRDLRILKLFLQKKAKIDIPSENSGGFITDLAAAKKYSLVKLLLRKNPRLAKKRYSKAFGTTALMTSNSFKISKLLIQYGAPINAQDRISGLRAIDYAARPVGGKSLGYSSPQWKIIDLLIKHGSFISPKNKRLLSKSRKPYVYKHDNYFYFKKYQRQIELIKIVSQGHIAATKELLNYIKNIDIKNTYGESILRLAVRGGHLKIIKMLLASGAKVTKGEHDAINMPLNASKWSLYKRDKKAIAKLLKSSKNQSTFHYSTANLRQRKKAIEQMVNFARIGNLAKLKIFIDEYGVPINSPDRSGRVALIESSKKGKSKIVRFLLMRNAYQSKSTATKSFCFAAAKNNLALMKLLLGEGTAINDKYPDGQTALFFASRAGNLNIIKFLIRNGANKKAKDNTGKTAYNVAKARKKYAVMKYLAKVRVYPSKSVTYFKNKYGVKKLAIADKTTETRVINKHDNLNRKNSNTNLNVLTKDGYVKIIYSNGKSNQILTKRQMVFMGGKFRTNKLSAKNLKKAKKLAKRILQTYPKGMLKKYFSFIYFAERLRGNETSKNGARVIMPLKTKHFLALNISNRQVFHGAHYTIAKKIVKRNLKKKLNWTRVGYSDRQKLRKAKFNTLRRAGFLSKKAIMSVNVKIADYVKMLYLNPNRLLRYGRKYPKIMKNARQVFNELKSAGFLFNKIRGF